MRRDSESGFALLLVFLMAAVIAISLYSEIPRIAFQAQRQKEQLLVERGEQYKRAIQVFYATTRQYPRSVADLEDYQSRHFLRHQYIDPMTGKSEWRVIHIENGVVTDSLVKPAQQTAAQGAGQSSYISAYAGVGQNQILAGDQQLRPQDRRRASEGGAGGLTGPVFPGAPDPTDDSDAATQQPDSGAQPGQPMPGMAGGAIVNPATGQPYDPAQNPGSAQGQNPQAAGSFPGAPYQTSVAGTPLTPAPQGQAGQNVPPGFNPAGMNAAASMINQILTTPNPRAAQIVQQNQLGGIDPSYVPGGGAANGPGPLVMAGQNPAGGTGIAGFASTDKAEAIMVYNDRTAYNEWEFLFDPLKVVSPTALMGGASGQQNQSQSQSQSQSAAQGAGGRQSTTTQAAGGVIRTGSGTGATSSPGAPAGMQTTGTSTGLPPVRMGRP